MSVCSVCVRACGVCLRGEASQPVKKMCKLKGRHTIVSIYLVKDQQIHKRLKLAHFLNTLSMIYNSFNIFNE